MARRKEPKIPDAILDQLLGGADPKTAFDPIGLLDDLKKALAERALNAEMDHHLANGEAGNSRNGYGKKTVVTDTARIELDVPRDQQSSFDPHLIAKYQRRFPASDEIRQAQNDRAQRGSHRAAEVDPARARQRAHLPLAVQRPSVRIPVLSLGSHPPPGRSHRRPPARSAPFVRQLPGEPRRLALRGARVARARLAPDDATIRSPCDADAVGRR